MSTHQVSPGAKFAVALGTVWVGLCTITGLVLVLQKSNSSVQMIQSEIHKTPPTAVPHVQAGPPITKMNVTVVDPGSNTADVTHLQAVIKKH